jgi:hypothetical protein
VVTISGQYPNARYFSINAYNSAGASYTCGSANAPSALADYLIAPDTGSQNPFQTSAAPGGRYTITLAHPGAGEPASPNTVPLYEFLGCQPATSQGVLPSTLSFLVLRVYLPQNGFANVALPSLTLNFTDGHSLALPQCHGSAPPSAATDPPIWANALRQLLAAADLIGPGMPSTQPCGRPGTPVCPPELTFFRPPNSATAGFVPNVDNEYVAALVRPKPNELVVVRAKAASFPPGMQAQPWNPQAINLRYWSLCSNIYRRPWPVVVVSENGQTILGCAPDLATAQDNDGFYTYVVSHVSDRPSDAALAANAATWLPFSNTQPYARSLLILRNMLGADFLQSVQNCAAGSDPGSIASCKASMSAYYPETAECQAQTFETGGTAACFSEYQGSER